VRSLRNYGRAAGGALQLEEAAGKPAYAAARRDDRSWGLELGNAVDGADSRIHRGRGRPPYVAPIAPAWRPAVEALSNARSDVDLSSRPPLAGATNDIALHRHEDQLEGPQPVARSLLAELGGRSDGLTSRLGWRKLMHLRAGIMGRPGVAARLFRHPGPLLGYGINLPPDRHSEVKVSLCGWRQPGLQGPAGHRRGVWLHDHKLRQNRSPATSGESLPCACRPSTADQASGVRSVPDRPAVPPPCCRAWPMQASALTDVQSGAHPQL